MVTQFSGTNYGKLCHKLLGAILDEFKLTIVLFLARIWHVLYTKHLVIVTLYVKICLNKLIWFLIKNMNVKL